jgi:hypothetical protein
MRESATKPDARITAKGMGGMGGSKRIASIIGGNVTFIKNSCGMRCVYGRAGFTPPRSPDTGTALARSDVPPWTVYVSRLEATECSI